MGSWFVTLLISYSISFIFKILLFEGQPNNADNKQYFIHDWYDRTQLKYLGLNDAGYYVNMWVVCKLTC
jgi:hypothetical protein